MRYVLGFVFALMLGGAVQAEDVSGAEIRSVISKQIDAFQEDDFEAAFAFASPGIQGFFGGSDRFGQMVRQGYPMVWQPDEVRFLELVEVSGVLFQQVLITDGAGVIHVLAYQMQKVGEAWRINGVQLIQRPEEAA